MKAARAPFGRVARTVAQKCLDEFGRSTAGLRTAVLVSPDGFELAAFRLGENDAARMGALGSSLAAMGAAVCREAGLEGFERLLAETADGSVLVLPVPGVQPPMVLAIVAENTVVLGQLLWSAKGCLAALTRSFRGT